jgi:hypothetical protein
MRWALRGAWGAVHSAAGNVAGNGNGAATATRSNGAGSHSIAATGSGNAALQGSASRQDGVNVGANGSASGQARAGRQSPSAN